MLIANGTRPSTSGSAIRLSFAQSSATSVRSDTSSGQRRRSSASGMNWYSPGSGASPYRTITASLPSWSTASFVARSEPSASPSGFSCVVRRNCSRLRIASATAARSVVVVWGELINQLRHPHAALDRRIVLERQLRSPLQPQLARNARLQHGMRRLQTFDRLHALPLGTENRDEHARVAKVRRRLDSGHRDEADPRILEPPHRLRQHLADGFVDTSHPVGHARYSSGWTFSSWPRSASGASPLPSPEGSSGSCSGTSVFRRSSSSPRRPQRA